MCGCTPEERVFMSPCQHGDFSEAKPPVCPGLQGLRDPGPGAACDEQAVIFFFNVYQYDCRWYVASVILPTATNKKTSQRLAK